jgi:TonB-linked SusC/RagA family outer membrane protein
MKPYILITLFICCLFGPAYGQTNITGQVNNLQTGEPVQGATVRMSKGGQKSASGSDGSFKIKGRALGDSLIVTHLGFDPYVVFIRSPADAKDVSIKLRPNLTTLQEVVVATGYQSISKERATGSFTQLNNQKLNEQVSPDIISRLESISSGLFFDRTTSGTPQIQVRGLSTINGPTAPLIVLDNFPYDGDINNINPNDVDNITILKDAAAASIWGTRAGNGVIVITTKKAKFNQPLSVELNASLTVGAKPDLSYIKQMNSGDYIDVEKMLFANGYYSNAISDPGHPFLSPVVELLSAAANGSISAAAANSRIDGMRNLDVRNDFSKYFYQKSSQQQYSVTLKGGVYNQSWLFSSGYDKDISSLNAPYDRINVHFQDTYKPLENLQLGASIFYTKSTSGSGRPGYGDINQGFGNLYPYAQLADANGNALPVAKDYSLSYLSSLPKGLLDWRYYPLTDYQQSSNTTQLQDININISGQYQLFKFLKINIQYQFERQSSDNNNYQGVNSYAVRNLINSFSQVDGSGNVTSPVPYGGILNLAEQAVESQNIRGQLNFNKTFGKNDFTALAGAEVRQTNTTGNSSGFFGYDPNTLTFGSIDFTHLYPTYITGASNFIGSDSRSLSQLYNRFVSVFANAAYTYDEKYTLSVSARRDASNLFGVSTNDKWNPLGSVGGSWDISKESFYKADFLPYLRLRATYGISGNVDLSRTAVTTISYLGNSPYTQTPYATYNTYANPDLKWETSAMFNIGLDFRAFNNRLSGSVEYFHKNNKNLFGNAQIDYTAGIGNTVVKNAASMEGSGADISLTSLNLTGKFKWSTTLNLSFYNDKITQDYLPYSEGYNFVSTQPSISGVVGRPVYSILSFKSTGLDPANGNPRGYINGQLSEDYASLVNNSQLSDLVFSGSAIPTKYGNFSNSFSYNQFSLTVNISYKLGYYFRKNSIDYSTLFAYGSGNSDFAKRWQKPGDETHTDVPSLVYPDDVNRDAFYLGSQSLVDKGDNIRLQYINLSYDLTKQQFPRMPFKTVKFYLNASNLGIIWKANKDNIDPDYNYGPNSLKPPVTFAIGVRTSF